MTLKELGNGTRTTYTYDASSRPTQLRNSRDDGSVLSSFVYTFDNVGNRMQVVEQDGTLVSWNYDRKYQLTSEHRSSPTPSNLAMLPKMLAFPLGYLRTTVYHSVYVRPVRESLDHGRRWRGDHLHV